MNTVPFEWLLVAAVVIITLLALEEWLLSQKKTEVARLFGRQHGRAFGELGARTTAEAESGARGRGGPLSPLAPAEAARFSHVWSALQGRFLDNPNGAVVQADQLIRELMRERGYPVADFERRAADVAVDHPIAVENYRAARAIAVRNERGEANAEELLRAIMHYGVVFDEMLTASG